MAKPHDVARGARRAMMGISWMELMVIVVVAMIVIGPKDLPAALRTLGRSFGAIRRMTGEVRSQFDQLIRDSEIETMRRGVEDTVKEAGRASSKARVEPVDQAAGAVPPVKNA